MKRWFEHEHLSDDLATLAFAGEWVRVLSKMLEKCGMDVYEDPKGKPVPVPFLYQGHTVEYFKQFRDGEDWKHFARLRTLCDRQLLPYGFFCDIAAGVLLGTDQVKFEIAEVRESMILTSVMEEVRERIATGPIIRSKQEFFKASSFSGHVTQVEYFSWIFKRVQEKYGPRRDLIIEKMVNDGVISVEIFKEVDNG